MRADDIIDGCFGTTFTYVALPTVTELLSQVINVAQLAVLQYFFVKSLCSQGAVERLPYPFPIPGRESVLRTGGQKHVRESRRREWISDSCAVFFFREWVIAWRTNRCHSSSNLYSSSSDRYLLDNMSCARAIDVTGGGVKTL